MRAALSQLLLLWLFALCWDLSRSSSCSSAFQKVVSLAGQEAASSSIYSSPTATSSTDGMCSLSSTCCSSNGEQYLVNDTAAHFKSMLFNKLNNSISPCLNNTLIDVTNTYIDQSKAVLLQGFQVLAGNSFSTHQNIFDDFYNYLKSGLTSLSYCNLDTEFQKVYFTLYTTVFVGTVTQQHFRSVPTGDDFNTCFYDYFWNKKGNFTLAESKKFGTRYNIYFKFLRGIKVAENALASIISHGFSSDCMKELAQLRSCSLCAGMSLSYCPSHCINVMRGCLVDIEEFSSAFALYNQSLSSAYNQLVYYNPFKALSILQTNLIVFAQQTQGATGTIMNDLRTKCNVDFPYSFGRRKRSTAFSSYHSLVARRLVAKRQTTSEVDAVLSRTVSCTNGIRLMFNGLTSGMCSSSTPSDCNCWNGTDEGSYQYTQVSPDRLSQRHNPELYTRADTGLLYKDSISLIMNVSREMDSCSSNVACDIQLCNIQLPTTSDYDITAGTNRYDQFQDTGYPSNPVTVTSTTSCAKVSTTPLATSTESVTTATTTTGTSLSTRPMSTTITTSTTVTVTTPTSIVTPSSTPSRASSSTTKPSSYSTNPPSRSSSTTTSTSSSSSSSSSSRSTSTSSSSSSSARVRPTSTPGTVGTTDIPDDDKPKPSGSGYVHVSLGLISLFIIVSLLVN